MYLCTRDLVISVLMSLEQELSGYIWFVWSKNHIVEKMLDVTLVDNRRTMECEDRAGILETEFAIKC